MTAIAFFHVDIGRPWWQGAVKNLIQSARDTQPNCRIMQLTDEHTGIAAGVDHGIVSKDRIDATMLMMAKGQMWSTVGKEADRPTVLCDADIEFRRDMAPLFAGDWDVGLIVRKDGPKASGQPYLAAMALTKPTPGAVQFWTEYWDVLRVTPRAWWAWWCDQIAFASLLGVVNAKMPMVHTKEYTVKLFDAELLAPCVPRADAYTLHFKGHREVKQAS